MGVVVIPEGVVSIAARISSRPSMKKADGDLPGGGHWNWKQFVLKKRF